MRKKCCFLIIALLICQLILLLPVAGASAGDENPVPQQIISFEESSPSSRRNRNTVSVGVQNIVKRAYQMTNIQWTPQQDIYGWASELIYKTGTTYTGLPYGQPVDASYVPWSTDLDGFLVAVNDSNSKMYTSYATYNERAPYYSIDCSAFVSWAWGLSSRQTTSSIANYATLISKTSYTDMEVGDCFNKAGSHVVLVTDIIYTGSGDISAVEISESTVNAATHYCCQRTWYGEGYAKSLSDMQSKYLNSGYYLYRCKTRDSVTYTHSCASPLDGDSCSLCNVSGYTITPVYAKVIMQATTPLLSSPGVSDYTQTTAPGKEYVVIACAMDEEGMAWYQTENGQWLYSGDLLIEKFLQSVTISGESFPIGALAFGDVFIVEGSIRSVNPLISITAEIFSGTNTYGEAEQAQTVSFGSPVYSYSLQGSAIDNAMRFNDLEDGEYIFQITVKERANSPANGQSEEFLLTRQTAFSVTGGTHVHNYGASGGTAATCTQSGEVIYTCTCGETYTETIAPLGHSFTAWKMTAAPTCTEDGEESRICSNCGKVETQPLVALGHTFANGICSRCGQAENSETGIKKGDLDMDGQVTSADAVLLARYLVDLVSLSETQICAADLNDDGFVTSADAVMLAKMLVEY